MDEPHPRIRQLNATSNSRLVFDERADFTDERVNVRPPAFTRAEDPLHDPRSSYGGPKRGTYVGPGLSFAKAMLPHTTRDIYLVPAAWGATGFCANHMGELAWNAEPRTADALGGSLLLERALVRLDTTLRESGGILRGILWHQGGADSNDIRCAERYADNLVRMVERLRREARADARGESARGERAAIPFVAATMSRGVDERGDYSLPEPAAADRRRRAPLRRRAPAARGLRQRRRSRAAGLPLRAELLRALRGRGQSRAGATVRRGGPADRRSLISARRQR